MRTSDTASVLRLSFGIRLKYPANWIADEKNHPNDGDYTQIVGFLSKLDSDLVEMVGVYLKDVKSYNMNFEEYVSYYIEGIKRKIRKPLTFILNELTSSHIAGHNAYKLIYRVNYSGFNDTKTLEYLVLRGSKVYVVSYNTEPSRYESDLSKLQNMVDSFEIVQ
jgi:hypothetical protein